MKIQYIDPITNETVTVESAKSIIETNHWGIPTGWFEIHASQDEGGIMLVPSTTDLFVFGKE